MRSLIRRSDLFHFLNTPFSQRPCHSSPSALSQNGLNLGFLIATLLCTGSPSGPITIGPFFASQSHHKLKKKSFSGDVKYEAKFSFFLIHKRAKPRLPPCKDKNQPKSVINFCKSTHPPIPPPTHPHIHPFLRPPIRPPAP
jgi:hypothetical protein